MTLAHQQSAFMAQVLDDEAPLPSGWDARHAAGMSVYRNNYRSSVIEALRSTFERTERWVGVDTFGRAAAHHVISHPPSSWTLDDAGRGFDETCKELFAKDREVAELAWLEWTMLESFTAPDREPLDGAGFAGATAEFGDEDWANLRLEFIPGTTSGVVEHDMRAIWNATAKEEFERPVVALDVPSGILIWREGERPTFRMVEPQEVRAFDALSRGVSYGEACALLAGESSSAEEMEAAAMQAGVMLGRWLQDGLIASAAA